MGRGKRRRHVAITFADDGGFGGMATDVTVQDIREYRDYLMAAGRAPATVNRALVSLSLFLSACGRSADNPVRKVERVDVLGGLIHEQQRAA